MAIDDGIRESTPSWRARLRHLKARGMNAPVLAIGDGAMGFWGAWEALYPSTRPHRWWLHTTSHGLNALPKSAQPNANQAVHEIWQAEPQAAAARAFDLCLTTSAAKYPKATACGAKDREEVLTCYAFPAPHWQHLRTTNPIESTSGTIRHRTTRTNGCLTRDGLFHMRFQLGRCAEQTGRRLRGCQQVATVITGMPFLEGREVTSQEPVAA